MSVIALGGSATKSPNTKTPKTMLTGYVASVFSSHMGVITSRVKC